MAQYQRERRAAGIQSAEYRAWLAMRARCTKPYHPAWQNYGGRGISVCERWMVYENFFADMGRKPHPSLTLERKDNDGNYEPANCVWADRYQQARNRRPSRRCKLNAAQVATIRARLAAGATASDLAEVYAVTPQNILYIKRGRTWRAVAPAAPLAKAAA